ncbi:MAG: AAA family ATPase, partial [Bacillota bacterium]|nr:AAA family ATPase [Bacillota bacterium]
SVFEKLGVTLEIDASVSHQLVSLFEPDNGVDSITPTIARLYETLVNLVLKRPKFESLALRYESGESVPIDRGDPGEEAALPYERGYRARIGDDDLLLDVEDDSEGEIAAIKKELEEIVGLEEVKRYMLSLEDVVRMQRIRKQTGMRVDEISKHMIFTGNPGTGKTTIARLVSRLMKAIGVLEQGQLVEVTRADLVGRYVGHTAPLTMSVIRSALGGVLFIDEAYSLYRGKDDSFGLEAIDTLVKAMEDHRDDLIVILAGYSKEMAEFLESNSGLRSRFPNRIFFRDYTADELVRIAQSVAKRKEYRIEETALEPLRVYFEKKQEHPAENGNGRLARNVVEAAIIKQSNRLVAAGNEFRRDELDQLIPEDFELDA